MNVIAKIFYKPDIMIGNFIFRAAYRPHIVFSTLFTLSQPCGFVVSCSVYSAV